MIGIKLVRYDKKLRKNSFDFDLGIDHYTSASSDMIDLKENYSACHADTRLYPSVAWSRQNEQKGTTINVGVSSSTEFDYQSFGGTIGFSKRSSNKNREFTAKLQTYLDQVKLVTPVELRSGSGNGFGDDQINYATSSRNTFSGSLSYSQVINERLQVMLLADVVQQPGFLGLPFHRVYFADGSVQQEDLPRQPV